MRIAGFIVLVILISGFIILWRLTPKEERLPFVSFIKKHWFIPVLVLMVMFGLLSGLSLFPQKFF